MSVLSFLLLVLTAAGPAVGDWQILEPPAIVASADWQILGPAAPIRSAGDWAILTQSPKCLCGASCTCEQCAGDCAPGYTADVVAAAIDGNKPLVVAVDLPADKLPTARKAAIDAGKLFCTARAEQGFSAGLHELTPRGGKLWVDGDGSARTWRVSTRPSCGSCKAAVRYLLDHGQTVETIAAGDNETVPQIQVGGETIEGFNRQRINELLAGR